ncbi:hypothetical protein SH1V18_37840 [Vallitalea longa]|uniref:Uncharacterized protein n=1 Tax=Vallitalea longa TaxID=2936439 RepID=A0A9W5YDZ7_9FIRM|nr:hypothetical protein [Vallitalea longa]GKX31304.1 hypothetical protein SH1V18_37840 [Vallitalea longa]
MPWCPKCKCEYEEGVKLCADCKVELVDSLDDIVEWRTLIKANKEEQAVELKEYLEYSGVQEVKYEKIEDEEEENGYYFSILVTDKEIDESIKYLKGYMLTKAKDKKDEDLEDDEEEVTNEYETEDYKDDTKLKDLKSSVYSFGIIGAVLLVGGILAMTEVITISFSNKYLFSGIILAVGIAFIIIAINSATRVGKETKTITHRDSSIDRIIEWFGDNYSLDDFAKKHDMNLQDMDEGDIYYIVMDKLKEIISAQFVEMDKKLVNTAAEIIFEKMSK